MLCLGGTIAVNTLADFFDTLADRWDELCFHDPEKLTYMLDHTGIQPGMRMLDIGCGTGVLESYLLPYVPKQIVGVDISAGMINRARQKYATPLVEFRCMDVMGIQCEKFDYMIAYSVFPHFTEPERLIKHLTGLLNPEGVLVICHSEGRDKINGHHDRHAGKLSTGLPPATELATLMKQFFTIGHIEDNERLYMITGINKTI